MKHILFLTTLFTCSLLLGQVESTPYEKAVNSQDIAAISQDYFELFYEDASEAIAYDPEKAKLRECRMNLVVTDGKKKTPFTATVTYTISKFPIGYGDSLEMPIHIKVESVNTKEDVHFEIEHRWDMYINQENVPIISAVTSCFWLGEYKGSVQFGGRFGGYLAFDFRFEDGDLVVIDAPEMSLRKSKNSLGMEILQDIFGSKKYYLELTPMADE